VERDHLQVKVKDLLLLAKDHPQEAIDLLLVRVTDLHLLQVQSNRKDPLHQRKMRRISMMMKHKDLGLQTFQSVLQTKFLISTTPSSFMSRSWTSLNQN
jgi:hypothetical protein